MTDVLNGSRPREGRSERPRLAPTRASVCVAEISCVFSGVDADKVSIMVALSRVSQDWTGLQRMEPKNDCNYLLTKDLRVGSYIEYMHT